MQSLTMPPPDTVSVISETVFAVSRLANTDENKTHNITYATHEATLITSRLPSPPYHTVKSCGDWWLLRC